MKPANLLLDEQGTLLLADFGIARRWRAPTRFTATGEGVGTPEYMAPEQARGPADGARNLYAAAIILYEMLTDRVPFGGASAIEVLLRHVQDPLPVVPLRTAQPALPPAIEAVLLRALAKDPGVRYQRGSDLVVAVEAAFAPPRQTAPQVPIALVVSAAGRHATARRGDRRAAAGVPAPPSTQPVAPIGAADPTPGAARDRRSVSQLALAVALLFGSAGAGAWFVSPRLDPVAATKTVALFDPTRRRKSRRPRRRDRGGGCRQARRDRRRRQQRPSPLHDSDAAAETGPPRHPAGWKTTPARRLPRDRLPDLADRGASGGKYVISSRPIRTSLARSIDLGKEKSGTTIDSAPARQF